jgi:RNA polymerase-binding transcription factor DksA
MFDLIDDVILRKKNQKIDKKENDKAQKCFVKTRKSNGKFGICEKSGRRSPHL